MFEVSHITAGYGDSTVLRDVSLLAPPASVVALIGPNGAGKTTLLKVASGLLRSQSGRIEVDGRDLTGADPATLVRAGVCHIPEGRGIFPNLTVRENLSLFTPEGLPDGMTRAIDAFPVLGQRLGQIAGTMSGGQQQIVALARAYVSGPRFVLIDEVSMGLAPKLVDEIFEFIIRLANEGVAIVLVEQYVTKALAIADYVSILNRGSITFVGEPSELDESELVSQYLGATASATNDELIH